MTAFKTNGLNNLNRVKCNKIVLDTPLKIFQRLEEEKNDPPNELFVIGSSKHSNFN